MKAALIYSDASTKVPVLSLRDKPCSLQLICDRPYRFQICVHVFSQGFVRQRLVAGALVLTERQHPQVEHVFSHAYLLIKHVSRDMQGIQ